GTRSWKKRLSPVFGKDWVLCPLDIDYRNPKEVAEKAWEFAQKEGLNSGEIRAVRSVKGSLEEIECDDPQEEGVKKLVECAKEFVHSSRGTVALITGKKLEREIREKVQSALEREFGKAEAEKLTQGGWKSQIAVRSIEDIKGIEYDAVVLIDPPQPPEKEGEERKIAASRLYVAMTRPTQKLVIVKRKGARLFI
ncbi:MAG: ATP-binding domain-containing protein, partial [Aeriscardovia sp.]|nr:ATP-binding domain-containing protein [Aeriscardovia sp.]